MYCCWKREWLSVTKTLKMLVRLLQNRLIFSKIRQENILKIGHIFNIIFCFLERSTQKFVRKSCKICQFSANLSLKILQNLTFFSAIYQRPWLAHSGLSDKGQCKMQTVDWLRTIVVRVRTGGGPTTPIAPGTCFVYLWSTDLWHHIRLQSCCSVFARSTKMDARCHLVFSLF